jgi:hypothetical protein
MKKEWAVAGICDGGPPQKAVSTQANPRRLRPPDRDAERKSLGRKGPSYGRWARRYRMETVELLVHRGSLLDELGR